jgi:hypothetical protein
MRRIRIPCLYINYPLEDSSRAACAGFGPVVCLHRICDQKQSLIGFLILK